MRLEKLLIANRGEIACRVIETCQSLGVRTVAVYSDADAKARHVAMADEAVRLGPAPVGESYLLGDAVIAAALKTGADAIHPGYGFLSENPDFVEAVEAAGLIFVGPSPEAIRSMGLKDQAKRLMEKAGVPVVPGYHGGDQALDVLAAEADRIGYPVLIKARAGGGGKGMRLVERAGDFAEALTSAAREAEASFGDPACIIEKYITSPRHIEVQVFGDSHGSVVHLFERDCSLQRRHQKVIEEAPAPGMTEDLRNAMGAAAVQAAKAVDYTGAGTVEFIVDGAAFPDPSAFWFMEMNTRLQVEHPVTECVTGLDLVALQLSVARGAPLPFTQDDLTLTGHAIEARLYAEDPSNGFLPATGRLNTLRFEEGVREDTGVREGDVITPFYDPMISKVIAHGPDRGAALRLLDGALSEARIIGVETNRDLLIRLLRDPDFAAGHVDTGLIERRGEALVAPPFVEAVDHAMAALCCLRPNEGDAPFQRLANYRHFGPASQIVRFEDDTEVTVETGAGVTLRVGDEVLSLSDLSWESDTLTITRNGHTTSAHVIQDAGVVHVDRNGSVRRLHLHVPGLTEDSTSAAILKAPLSGRVVAVSVKPGDTVTADQTLLVVEAMKMEHRMVAPRGAVIAEVNAEDGDQVEQSAVLIRLEEEA